MRGVIMETQNGRAVLLTKGGEFVNIKDKGYLVGDKVNITSNTGHFCAMAASLVVICAGIGSYFMPAGYVSVDINPSLMMTLNPYNRVIDVKSFNDDARVLLDKTDIKGKSAEESVEMLISASEEIGYINDNNRDVILEVVPGIRKPNMDGIKYKNIELEIANRETLRIAQNIGVSIAKAKALEEYTEKNGGDVRSNAAKFNDKSVKEIRNIMIDNGHLSDKKAADAPLQKPKYENISEPPAHQENRKQDYKPAYNISNTVPVGNPKREENKPPANQPPQNEYRPPENVSAWGDDKPQEIPPKLNEPPHWEVTQAKPDLQLEQKPQENTPVQGNNISQQINEPIQEKPTVDSNPVHIEQKPQSSTGSGKPQGGGSEPSAPKHEDNKPSDNAQQIPEQKPQDNIPNQGDKSLTNNQPSTEQKPNESAQGNDKPQNNPSESKHEPVTEQGGKPSQPDKDTKPQPNKPPQENNIPPQAEPKPSEPQHEDGSGQNQPPQTEPKPQDGGGNHMGEHNRENP